jgi:hypothetical protein
MSKTPSLRIALAGLALALSIGSAQAQGIEFGPGGLRIDPGPERYAPRPRYDGISEREAVRIARRQGVDEVERVRETPRGWRISGLDRNGDEIRVIVSRDGDVIDVR